MNNYDNNNNQYYGNPQQPPIYPPQAYDQNNYQHYNHYPQQSNSNYNSGNGFEPQYSQGMVLQGNGQLANVMRKTFIQSQTWEEKTALIKSSSVFGHLEGWKLKSFIVKAGDDLRKEILAMQIIEYCQEIFKAENIDIILRPYQIICTSHQAGLVEFIETARSIDRIKKSSPDVPTLKEFYEFSYGPSYSLPHAQAVQNFVKSLVGYSLITYLLQVKDRHNANLLIDRDGSIIHIDFGFIMGESPGFNINFENAPFKLTREYIEVMGGIDSAAFKSFEDLFLRGFYALKKHVDGLSAVVQLFYGDRKKDSANQLRSRLDFASSPSEILMLVRDSADNWRTKQYDWFQQRTNNILM
jgi:phosphatidylinositol 4-kinase